MMIAWAAVVVLVLALSVTLLLAAMKPDEFVVERSQLIQAPAEKIYPRVGDFHGWTDWSPWEKLDPGMKRTYSGAASGTGAIYEWDGNKKVGAGRMEIVETSSPNKVRIQLDFLRPFEGHNTAEFLLSGKNGGTAVRWTMRGTIPNFGFKIMHVFMNMDKMIGRSFESGLSNLKTLSEK